MSKDRAAQLVEAGIWLKLSGDREGARKLFERALKLDPGNEKATQLLAGASVPIEVEPPAPPPTEPLVPPVRKSLTPAPGTNPFEPPASTGPSSLAWGLATGNAPPRPPAVPELSLDSDWGRLTGAATPVPQPNPEAPAKPEVPWSTSPSSSNVALDDGDRSPRQTMVAWGGSAGSSPAISSEPPRNTLVGWAVPPDAPAPRTTLPGWSPVAPQSPQVISLSGDAPAESPPRSTPPLFSAAPPPLEPPVELPGDAPPAVFSALEPPRVVEIGGEAGPETPPPSTPPIFASPPTAAPPPPAIDDSLGFAWSWSASSPPPAPAPVVDEEPPAPRPSPTLAPRAESAWDARSNPGIKLEAVVGHDRALDLISSDSKITHPPRSQKDEVKAILRGARDLLELDDHTGAMELIVKAQTIAPDDPDVQAMRERSEKTLLNMFESKLGKLETIPRVLLKDDEIIWLNLDHRAGFVLAQIDGTVSFDDLFSVSGMSRIDTARILAQLVEEGVISRG